MVVALVLPQSVEEVDRLTGAGAGIAVFILLTLGYELIDRRRRQTAIVGELNDLAERQGAQIEALRALNRGLVDDIALARQEMAELCDVVESAAEGANQSLLQEMRSLRLQLGQVSNDWGEQDDPHRQLGQLEDGLKDPSKLQRPLPPQVTQTIDDNEILDIIQEALEENRVDLYLQPVVTLPQRRTRFYEAYSRIRTPDGEVLLPQSYLEIAQRKGLMEVVDNLLLFRCVQLVRRLQSKNTTYRFFVNVSPFTMRDAVFLGQFIDFMTSNRKLAGHIVFEFELASFLELDEEVRGQLSRLASLGFEFSTDRVHDLNVDFSGLAERHVRFVKIPAERLIAIGTDSQEVVERAKHADVDVICDHIEQEREVAEILDYNVDYGQGYLFGTPRPLRENV